jgi:hypothetical protein
MFGIDSFGFDVLAAAACTTSTAKVLVNLWTIGTIRCS